MLSEESFKNGNNSEQIFIKFVIKIGIIDFIIEFFELILIR